MLKFCERRLNLPQILPFNRHDFGDSLAVPRFAFGGGQPDLNDLAQYIHTLPPVVNGPFGHPDM